MVSINEIRTGGASNVRFGAGDVAGSQHPDVVQDFLCAFNTQ